MTTFKQWILETYDRDELKDIAAHGCVSCTAHGLIYYHETAKAHDQHEEEIWQWISNTADELGHKNEMELISSFNGSEHIDCIGRLKNILVWAYVEHVAFYHIEEIACEEEMV